MNEKQLVDMLLLKVLGESMEVEFLAGDTQLESEAARAQPSAFSSH